MDTKTENAEKLEQSFTVIENEFQQDATIEELDKGSKEVSSNIESELLLNRVRSSSSSSSSIKSSTSTNSDLTLLTALEASKGNTIISNELVDIPINLSDLENSETKTDNESISTPQIQNKTIWNHSSASKVHSAHVALETVSQNTTCTENDVLNALNKVIYVIKSIHKRTALGHIIGSLKALILIVNNYYYNTKIIKNCLKIILQLAKNFITRKAFGDYGISEVLVHALNHHINDESIAKYGLRTICNLTFENDNNRVKLVNAGVIETVLNLLSNNIKSEKVCFRGLMAISNLCFVDNENKKNVGRIGCNLVVNSLSMHMVKRDMGLYIPTFLIPVSEQIALWGCRSIVDLAEKNASNATYLGEIGACDEVVRCLEAYSGKKDVSKWALAAAATLMTDNVLNTQKFAQLHLVQHILKQLKLCKYSDALLTEIGLAALYHLSLNLNSKKEIIEAGGIDLVTSFPKNLGNRNDCLLSLTFTS